MFEYINYKSDKNELIRKMIQVKEHFTELFDMGIDVTDAIEKIDSVIRCVQEDNLSIVLVGAFSDGKTSVIAGWLNEKTGDMKIDSDESSDEILRYKPSSLPDGCQVVDTPGLFGDKIGNDEKGEKIALSDITKKYISEANVILYVVPAKNPIKDSHKSCIRWIMNDLNKLSSVIFVINRMDDIVDLTDEEEYDSQKRIKTENLRNKLLECGISRKDAEEVLVVCVSAAPDGKGIEAWKDFREEYLHRSHMYLLEEATNNVLKNSREVLITKTGCDVLNDELNKIYMEIKNQEQAIDDIILPQKKDSLKRNKKDLEALKKRIRSSRNDIKDDINKLKKSKLAKIKAATIDDFRDVMEEEIGIVSGKEGAVLSEEINTIYDKYADTYRVWTQDVGDSFQIEYNKQNQAVENLLKKGVASTSMGLRGAGKIGVNTFKQAVFAGRDVLGKLGIVIKFKPWQAVKIAQFCTKALPIIGALIDIVSNVVDNVSMEERNKKFKKSNEEIREEIEKFFIEECIDKINDDNWFVANFAPGVKVLEDQVKEDEEEIQQIEKTKDNYIKWSKRVNDIDCSII